VGELRDELLRGLEVELASSEIATEAESWQPGRDTTAAAWGARWILAALLIFLLTEPFLAWDRTAGLTVFVGLLAIGLAGTMAGLPAAMVVTVLFAIIGVWQFRRDRNTPLTS
jgi:hypothetical protein